MEKDSYKLGVEDGKHGKLSGQGQKLPEGCSEFGVNIDQDRYEFGRKEGMKDYCSDSRARDDAEHGKKDPVCESENVGSYNVAYTTAYENNRKDKQKQIEKLQSQQAKLKNKQEKTQTELDNMNQ